MPTDSTIYSSGNQITVLGNTNLLVRTDYTFEGWNTQSNGSGTDYQVADTFSMPASDVTLYAQWAQTEYRIGDTGPANGIIFYDIDADNSSGNGDGLMSSTATWRYLEAAPYDMASTGIASNAGREAVRFGYHRDSDDSKNLYVNGTDTFSLENCTGTEIGVGKDNTEMLVALIGDTAYSSSEGSGQDIYAALLCDQLEYGEYSDWFLPSSDELEEMQRNKSVIGNFQDDISGSYYWSSSEGYQANYAGEAKYAWYTDFHTQVPDPYTVSNLRSRSLPVRSIRRF